MKGGKNVAYYVFRTIVDMMKPKAEIVWDALASVGDAGAHKICVMTQENGKPIDLTGCTAQLLVQRQDEATRYLNADFDASGVCLRNAGQVLLRSGGTIAMHHAD